MIEIEKFKKERHMKTIHFSYSTLVITALVVSLAGCSHKRELDPRTEPELVRTVEVGLSSGTDPAFTGVVSARVESDLGFRVPGKITKRLVDTGQFVRAGQLLMTIDRTDYVHAITARSETVAAAKAKAVQAAADEARYRGLVKSGAVSASIYDQIKAASEAAQAELAAAKAQEQVARDEDDYSQLVADADGVVIETQAEPGQVVAAGQTVVKRHAPMRHVMFSKAPPRALHWEQPLQSISPVIRERTSCKYRPRPSSIEERDQVSGS